MREVNVWAGVHGDEWEAQALVHDLRRRTRRKPSVPVRAKMAHTAGHGFCREGANNLVFAFPGRRAPTSIYVEQRAAEIVRQSSAAYTTIDAHQIMHYGLRTAYIDRKRGVSAIALGFLRTLGIHSLVATDGWGMQGHIPNAFLLEATYNPFGERATIAQAIQRLACDHDHPTAQAEDFDWYRYAGGLNVSTYRPPRRNSESTFQPLQRLPDEVAATIGTEGLALHILNWREEPLRSGVWGEAVTPIFVPDTTGWPGVLQDMSV